MRWLPVLLSLLVAPAARGQVLTGILPPSSQEIATGDNLAVDAFGRFRVSGTGQRLDLEFLYDLQTDYADVVTNTNSSVLWQPDSRDVIIAQTTTVPADSTAILTHPAPYTPGNSQLVDVTGVLNGGNKAGTAEVFLRSSVSGVVTEQVLPQESWINLSEGVVWTNSQIFFMDFQSLKVGRIRFGLNQKGVGVPVAQIINDNLRASGYWQNPSLPVMWRMYNTGGATITEIGYGDEANAIGFRFVTEEPHGDQAMRAICATVKSEGGSSLRDLGGLPRSVDTGTSVKSVGTSLVPLLSIRVKDTFNGVPNIQLAVPKGYAVTMDNPIRLVVLEGATLGGAVWADVNTAASCVEYDTSATSITGGTRIISEYLATPKNTFSSVGGLLGKTVLWARRGGASGVLTLAAVRTAATDSEVLCGLDWEEIR